jgi:uncharacterized protein YutE (UPF0331/DUF86 family)/predicted nucleotidyltransferase
MNERKRFEKPGIAPGFGGGGFGRTVIHANHTFEDLKRYCEADQSIVLAFIFGSWVKGLAGEDSDIDFGVYLKDPAREDEIWMDLSRILEKEIDFIVLNDAPATLVSNVLKTGIPVAIKDRKLYLDLYLTTTLEAEDFSQFTQEYWKIYERSKSLPPEDKTRLIERMQFLESEFQEIENFKDLTHEEYVREKIRRRNIERWAENVINATIDIAKIILASEKKEIPKTYEQALLRFGMLAGLDQERAIDLASFARLRNILAHQYLDVAYLKIMALVREAPPLYAVVFNFLRKKI